MFSGTLKLVPNEMFTVRNLHLKWPIMEPQCNRVHLNKIHVFSILSFIYLLSILVHSLFLELLNQGVSQLNTPNWCSIAVNPLAHFDAYM